MALAVSPKDRKMRTASRTPSSRCSIGFSTSSWNFLVFRRRPNQVPDVVDACGAGCMGYPSPPPPGRSSQPQRRLDSRAENPTERARRRRRTGAAPEVRSVFGADDTGVHGPDLRPRLYRALLDAAGLPAPSDAGPNVVLQHASMKLRSIGLFCLRVASDRSSGYSDPCSGVAPMRHMSSSCSRFAASYRGVLLSTIRSMASWY